MNLEDQYKCLVGAYYGVSEMDEYDLKVYILKDIENYIKAVIEKDPIPNYDYKKRAKDFEQELSKKTKLQDALIVLNKMNAPMELILLIKKRLKNIDEEEL